MGHETSIRLNPASPVPSRRSLPPEFPDDPCMEFGLEETAQRIPLNFSSTVTLAASKDDQY